MASLPDLNLPLAQPRVDPGSPQEAFRRRVARLQNGQVARHVIWVGTDEAYEMPVKARGAAAAPRAGVLSNALYPLSLAAAVALGFLSHGLALVARYHLQGLPDPKANPDIEMVAQVVIGFSLAMVLGYVLGLRARELTSLKSLGAALGVLFFHNLVHAFPHVFDLLCSKAWVNYIVTHTKAHSLIWRGISFVW